MPRVATICVILIPLMVTLIAAVGLGWPGSTGEWFGGFGRLSGVAGLACMLVAGILSVRIPGLDRPFGGLTNLWILHHRLGLAAFIFILAHPPLMAFSVLPLGYDALGSVLLPLPGDLAMWAGWIALAATIVFLTPSFQIFGRPEYQRWKALHFVAGIALLGGIAHTIPLARSLPEPWPLVLWGILGGLAVAVFLWRATVARPLLRKDYEITACEPLAQGVVELSLRPAGGGKILPFRPGQFVYLTPTDDGLAAGRNEEHPYTITSSPYEDELRIAIKDLGDASRALQQVRTPSHARVEGPYGDFLPERMHMLPQLWIGGGIGITPFVSMVRAIKQGQDYGPVDLIYCANDRSRAYFLDELEAIAVEVPGFHVHMHLFIDEGPLTREFIAARCPDAAEREWFICGPVPLVRLVRNTGQAMNMRRRHIHTEEFSFL